MDKSRQWKVRLAAIVVTGLTGAAFSETAGAGPISSFALQKAAESVAMTELSHCRPWPHWHQWDWWGRGCGELRLPRDRQSWRLRQWRRLQ
jgi:hypothetical protein